MLINFQKFILVAVCYCIGGGLEWERVLESLREEKLG